MAYKLTAGKLGIDRTAGESLAPGLGCTGNGNNVTCAVDFITRLVIDLGPGDDTIAAAPTLPIGMHAEIHGGPGRDTLRGADGSNDLLFGDEGDDVLDGGFGDDTLDGGAGDDVLTANLGADVYRGGPGIDQLTYASYTAPVVVTVAARRGRRAGRGERRRRRRHRARRRRQRRRRRCRAPAVPTSSTAAQARTRWTAAEAPTCWSAAPTATPCSRATASPTSCPAATAPTARRSTSSTRRTRARPSDAAAVDAPGGGRAVAAARAVAPAARGAVDADGDGSPLGADCDDHDKAVHPGAREIPANGKDDDCDGLAASLTSPAIALAFATGTPGTKATVFSKLSLTGAPGGATVTLTCKVPKKAKGCPFAASTAKAKEGKVVSLATKAFKKAKLPVGTVLELRVAAGATVAVRVERLTVRAGAKPKRQTRCLNPVTQAALPRC